MIGPDDAAQIIGGQVGELLATAMQSVAGIFRALPDTLPISAVTLEPALIAHTLNVLDAALDVTLENLTELADMTDQPASPSPLRRLADLFVCAIATELERTIAARESAPPPNVVPLRAAPTVISAVGVAGPDVGALSMAEHALRDALQTAVGNDVISHEGAMTLLGDWRRRAWGVTAEEIEPAPTQDLRPQMTLGELAAALEALPPTALSSAMRAHSYRGYYEQLGFSLSKPVPAHTVAAEVRACIGQTFDGYKGGGYTMHEDTLVWVSTYGHADGQPIVGVAPNGGLILGSCDD